MNLHDLHGTPSQEYDVSTTSDAEDLAASGVETPPSVESVCVIAGAGRGECWGCPVTTCVLWQNPLNPFSNETLTVSTEVVRRLAAREVVQQPETFEAQVDPTGLALDLAVRLTDPDVAYRLKVDMAVESIIQDIHHADTVKRRNQYTDRWMKGLRGRIPTTNDDTELDNLMDQADADVVAEHYDVKAEDVLVRMRWFRKRRIVRLDRDV